MDLFSPRYLHDELMKFLHTTFDALQPIGGIYHTERIPHGEVPFSENYRIDTP